MVQLQPTNELDDILNYISLLQIADIDSLQARASNNHGATGDLNDEELAMLLFAQEAEGLLNITKDYASGSSSERPLLEELAAREDFQGEEGQRELRSLVTEAVGGLAADANARDVRRRRVG